MCRIRCYNFRIKKKTEKKPGYPKSLTQKEEEEVMDLSPDMGKEWDDNLKKYLNMMLYSDDKESIETATRALSRLLDEKEKKRLTLKSPKKTLGFSQPMFSAEEELLSDEYAEKAAKEMYDALSDKDE